MEQYTLKLDENRPHITLSIQHRILLLFKAGVCKCFLVHLQKDEWVKCVTDNSKNHFYVIDVKCDRWRNQGGGDMQDVITKSVDQLIEDFIRLNETCTCYSRGGEGPITKQ